MPAEPKTFRSVLFVPVNSESKLAKAKHVAADALAFDWEDAQLPEDKPVARRRTLELLKNRGEYPQVLLVRLNPAGSESFRDDCEALAEKLPDGLMLSKCDSAEDVSRLGGFLRQKYPATPCAVYPFIESPRGLLSASGIAQSCELVRGLAFGAEDFSTAMGIRRGEDERELLYARSALVTVCRAAGREVYDSPCTDFSDESEVRAASERARNLGFTGKLAIHPMQVAIVNAVFSPTPAEVEQARRLLDAFAAKHTGVVAVEGQMVDEPILQRARRILEQSGE